VIGEHPGGSGLIVRRWGSGAVIVTVAMILAILAGSGKALADYSSIVIDANTGAVLDEQNADAANYPASLTKMMTLYLVFDALERGRLTLKQPITVSSHAAMQAPSRLGLRAGQTITVEQAILALVTKSANDAAVAVAETLGGSESRFADIMTTRAQALGMKRSTFRNASGLPDGRQVTTARDMATLGRALYRDFPQYYSYFSRLSFIYRGRSIGNHNRLLRSYEGADGIKTGYIRAVGYNLAASAVRDGRRVVGVVLGSRTAGQRNVRMTDLLDRGFKQQIILAKAGGGAASSLADAEPPVPQTKPSASPIDVATASVPAVSGTLDTEEGDGVEEPDEIAASEGWAIQVGAFTRREPAERAAATALASAPDSLAGARPQVVEVITDSATIYRARLVGLEEPQAREACRILKTAQAACLTVRPGGAVDVQNGN
jgi:D-alanyl-D-alanine carboxypeptidase